MYKDDITECENNCFYLVFVLSNNQKEYLYINASYCYNTYMKSMRNVDVKDKFRYLIGKIRYYDQMYYGKNQSKISDVDYDLLREELETLENTYPELIEPDSPTQNISYMITDSFVIRSHNSPMLSLRNTYSMDEVEKFLNKQELWPVVLEPKLDGISLSLRYINSYLTYALLRGDGEKGEDVTNQIMHIKSIPLKLKQSEVCSSLQDSWNLEIRGEIHITKNNFSALNDYKKQKGEKIFQNSRNGTSGIIRYKGIEQDLYSYLSFTPYTILKERTEENQQTKFMLHYYPTQQETLDFLKTLGFTPSIYYLCNNRLDIEQGINRIVSEYSHIQDMDGVVIKTNNLKIMDQLGYNNRHPLGAIAYKFTNKVKETEIISIKWQVSRNGRVNPVAVVKPIYLDNANITNITLHNKSYLQEKQIGVGAHILVERVGSTVPQIKKVIKPSNISVVLEKCPSCKAKIIEDNINYLCKGSNCQEQIQASLYYFAKSLKLKGLGEKSIIELSKYVKNPEEMLIFIRQTPNMNIAGWEKFRFNMKGILRQVDAAMLLVSLGIESISYQGINSLLSLLKIYKLDELVVFLNKSNWQEMISNMVIPGFGKEKIQIFITFLDKNKVSIKGIVTEINLYLQINNTII